MSQALKPLVKWSGGKRNEIKVFERYFPPKDDIDTYIEPFVGGGSVLFHLNWHDKRNVLSDMHEELINFYKQVRDGKGEALRILMEQHPNSEETYYRVRGTEYRTDIEKAFQFYYLRKTCFRGMMRYNKQGKFNIPFGKYKSIDFKEVASPAYHALLKDADIRCCNFAEVFEEYNSPRNFVFLDPPYDSEFTDYGYCNFTRDHHIALAEHFKTTTNKCLMVIGSTPFIDDLYSGYIRERYKKKYAFKLYGNRIGDEIDNDHLIITNY